VELRAAHERFFAAFSREDMPAALAEASTAPEEREWVRATLQEEFDKASNYAFKIERFTVRHLEEPQAFTRARMSWSWLPHGKTQNEEGLQTWDFVWGRQGGSWKLRAYRFAEANLLNVFKAAADPAQRTRLLKQDSDIVGGWLPLALRQQADELAIDGKLDEGERLSTLAFEVAEWMDDDYERAYCHLSRGTVRKRAKKWNPALEDWDQARILFEKQNNNQGLAKVWRNSGGLYQQVAEFEKSVEAYEKSVGYWRAEKNEGAVAEVIQANVPG
jgi:tetratricopeptide (TPR) repeat protein